MAPDEIAQLVQSQIENSDVQVTVDGSHVNLVVVSPAFAGLTPVKQQQLVYATLQSQIASGDIHAVNMKTYTPERWAQLNA